MNYLLVFLNLFFLPFLAFSQTDFDSSSVSGKIKEHLLRKKYEIPVELKKKNSKECIEKRIDLLATDFDFSKTESPEYLQERTQDVMIVKFEDIKIAGMDIYIQNKTTRYSLTNLELHADSRGNIIKDLPFQEIKLALQLTKFNNLIDLQQADRLFKKHAQSGKEYAYVNLLIDLTSQSLKWQFHGKPNWQTKKQESLDIDAKTGKILSQSLKTINTAASLNK
jgi:hypothetical protein